MKTIWIDQAPLVASPAPTGNVVEVELLREVDYGNQLYVLPLTRGATPLYVFKHWVREAPKDKS